MHSVLAEVVTAPLSAGPGLRNTAAAAAHWDARLVDIYRYISMYKVRVMHSALTAQQAERWTDDIGTGPCQPGPPDLDNVRALVSSRLR